MAGSRPIVDARFPARLRELRRARGLSLRDLAQQAHVSKSHLSELENDVCKPSIELARHLDNVLEAGGELADMVIAPPEPPAEHADRVDYAFQHPMRLDAATVDALAGVLAAYRRLDDHVEARVLLPAVTPQWRVISDLARQARGRHARELQRSAAEWTQFAGWLLAEARLDADAIRTLNCAHAEAVELEDGPLTAQAGDFRSFIARLRGEWRPAAR